MTGPFFIARSRFLSPALGQHTITEPRMELMALVLRAKRRPRHCGAKVEKESLKANRSNQALSDLARSGRRSFLLKVEPRSVSFEHWCPSSNQLMEARNFAP
jgi:hypothetical protein